MLKFFKNLKKILPLTNNSLLPALLLAISLIGFYAFETISNNSMLTLHTIFYLFSFIIFCITIYFNRSQPALFILNIVLSYIVINYLKKLHGQEYIYDFNYINLTIILPINLVILYMLPNYNFFSKENLYIFIGFLIEVAIIEKLSNITSLGYNYITLPTNTYNDIGLIIAIIAGIILLFKASFNGRIMPSYMFFAFIEIIFAIIYSDSSTALSIFYSVASLTILIGLCYDIYYLTYKDVLTSLASRNTYMVQSQSFPLKYSVGIICIDDYERLSKGLKKHELNAAILMIANKIIELEKENPVYRYDKDEFIIIFKNENKEDSFNRIEKIRRAIASSEFIISKNKNPLKITISGSVSDKKRSDANSHEVLVRARKVLEKTNKFSQNVTTKA